ncbi:PTS fructose transporter subunit IIC [Aerococcus sp. CDC-944-U94]|uniref:PTS fructose transporter subunit IIC n=1 Tax=Aerococcus urinae (strain CCUG 59500 / ACS-120-V-Col10a) TaxID=2976812 RepID=UPI00227B5D17|nr:PTS fructose transporter subunit IIC [Aerococcus sp. Group 1]MCY3054469.1 PTS fructose transporter subunit IIC [Aerococcus sp. Group 1]MCY3056199.1 PTS fructose transporter subunit IIC [Aerococcus sp. Group 1]
MFKKLNLKGHLLTAISYLIPIVCGAGFLIAIGMALGGSSQESLIIGEFNFWDALATMGGAALGLLPVVISTGIAFSIAGKPGIAPGFIIGLTANAVGAGFIGGILGGYISGFLALFLIRSLKVPEWAKGLMPTLIIPLLTSLIGDLIMVYIIGGPVAWLTTWLTNFLNNLGSSSKLIFGGIIGLLSGIDYGGPVNKTVFAFVLTLQAEGINEPITALQLVNTATPIGFGLAHFIGKLFGKNIYSPVEVETLKSAVPMGFVNIAEGIIPIVMNDIVKGILATAVGGASGGAVALVMGADASVPFGGFLMLPTMTRPLAGLAALGVNILVTGLTYALIKEDFSKREVIEETDDEEEFDLDEITII